MPLRREMFGDRFIGVTFAGHLLDNFFHLLGSGQR
jgi:hypothetical protein